MIALLAGAVLAAGAQPAAAQPWSGDSDMSTAEIRALTHAYAKCVIAKVAGKASEALVLDIDNGTLLRRYPQLIRSECLVKNIKDSAEMRFSGDLYRYALADALVAHELTQFDPATGNRQRQKNRREEVPGSGFLAQQ
jgi:hypothetical protein